MASIIEMPKLGFDMAEGTLVHWVKSEGEEITKGAILAEIETDKATVEIESAYGGIVHHHLVKEGQVIPVGTPIAVIGEAGEKIDLQALLGKAIPAQGANEVKKQKTKTSEQEMDKKKAQPLPTKSLPPEPEGHFPEGVKASPLARRIAKEQGIDLKAVKGTGPEGRITKHDIEAFMALPPKQSITASAALTLTSISAPLPSVAPLIMDQIPTDKRLPLSRLRTAIGRRMSEAKQRTPHFYVTHEYNLVGVMAMREEINALLEGTEEKLSVNDFIVRATALALHQFPNLNASLDGEEIIQHGHINIGVAVSLDEGLLTVVCRDADHKSLRHISSELRAKATRARQGKVHSEDIEGSTFSISNMGMYDVENFIAIINPPEAATLAVGTIRQVPVVNNGEIIIGTQMKATLSVDHRISDGVEAARFMQTLATYLEEPLSLLI